MGRIPKEHSPACPHGRAVLFRCWARCLWLAVPFVLFPVPGTMVVVCLVLVVLVVSNGVARCDGCVVEGCTYTRRRHEDTHTCIHIPIYVTYTFNLRVFAYTHARIHAPRVNAVSGPFFRDIVSSCLLHADSVYN